MEPIELFPKFKEFLDFLESRFNGLFDAVDGDNDESVKNIPRKVPRNTILVRGQYY